MEPSVVVESAVGPTGVCSSAQVVPSGLYWTHSNRAPGNPQWLLLVPTLGYIGVCSPQWPLL
eukprot:6843233-Lingulodinium_polyedra.AAC.1